MGWSYPGILLDDLMKFVKSFVDILILVSGYQSNGRLAHWDSANIKKAFQWALFLENVSKSLSSSDSYKESVDELDAALAGLKSYPYFPQGLAYLPWSTATLSQARKYLLKHLICTIPLRESHLETIITASVEMDLSQLECTADDCLQTYLEKLSQNPFYGSNISRKKVLHGNTKFSSLNFVPIEKHDNLIDSGFSMPAITELGQRKMTVICSYAVETCLEIISNSIRSDDFSNGLHIEGTKRLTSLMSEELPIESVLWQAWRLKNLNYMLDIRTTRLVSGARLIFSAPESQWIQMFNCLNSSAQRDDTLCETIELLLFGCIADKWNSLIEHLMLVSYDALTISRIYKDIVNLSLAKSQNILLGKGLIDRKEKHIMDYLELLVGSQIKLLWKLSPVIAGVAIPSWSQMFRSYVLELEGQLKGESSVARCCNCITDGVEHTACEVAVRIWCLYIFQIANQI